RVAVVDDETEAAFADRLQVDAVQEVLRIRLAHTGGIVDAADCTEGSAAQLSTREVLLQFLLQRGRHRYARRLEEADLHDFGIGLAGSDVHAGVVALALEEMSRNGGGQYSKVPDVEARRGEPRDERALRHPAGR